MWHELLSWVVFWLRAGGDSEDGLDATTGWRRSPESGSGGTQALKAFAEQSGGKKRAVDKRTELDNF